MRLHWCEFRVEEGRFKNPPLIIGLKTVFWIPNLHFGHVVPDSTKYEVMTYPWNMGNNLRPV